MQSAAFAARGLDWAYVPLPVEPEDLEAAVSGLGALGFAGANVTIPHKTAIVSCCDELDGVAERAGSVNTLVIRDGRVLGSSTDGLAVTDAVRAEGARALILGAGGAAVAVAVALLDAGVAGVTVAARDPDRAHALAARLLALFPQRKVAAAAAWPPQPADATLLVNATPLREELPVEPRAGQAVVDLAYRTDGDPTTLIAAARAAGCDPIVDGLEVLARQGAASFERWTGVSAPIDVMRFAIRADENATKHTRREE
jgi:shikimate dehydrogenase